MDEEKIACLALNRIPGLGPATYSGLLRFFGSARSVFEADRHSLDSIPVLSSAVHSHIAKGIESTGVGRDLEWLECDSSHRVLFLHSNGYPHRLKQIAQPPPVLYLKGRPRLLRNEQLAIVGSRNPTPGGIENAFAMAQQLAECGLTITSGLACGIDGAAHRGAMAARNTAGRTVAVMANGLDRIYPAQHRALAAELADNGLLISEFPVGSKPKREFFPRRNRIISGLSLGTLVVEAAVKSGSLITARYALEQGREVFAIPGSIHSPQSRGCHWLIKQGAKLVEASVDIAEEILPILQDHTAANPVADVSNKTEKEPGSELSTGETTLLECIGFDPVSFDRLAERTDLATRELSAALGKLEMDGRIDLLPGGRYLRKY